MACNLKTAGRKAKRSEIWDSGVLTGIQNVWGAFYLLMNGHMGVIWCTCLKMACNSKMTGRIVKRSEI